MKVEDTILEEEEKLRCVIDGFDHIFCAGICWLIAIWLSRVYFVVIDAFGISISRLVVESLVTERCESVYFHSTIPQIRPSPLSGP